MYDYGSLGCADNTDTEIGRRIPLSSTFGSQSIDIHGKETLIALLLNTLSWTSSLSPESSRRFYQMESPP